MFEPKSSAALKAGEISTTVGKRAKVGRGASRYLLTLEDEGLQRGVLGSLSAA